MCYWLAFTPLTPFLTERPRLYEQHGKNWPLIGKLMNRARSSILDHSRRPEFLENSALDVCLCVCECVCVCVCVYQYIYVYVYIYIYMCVCM
jgi:hypothetical protein